jgi:hypothetical protein
MDSSAGPLRVPIQHLDNPTRFANQENPTEVWDSGYDMVQHLAESQSLPPAEWQEYEGNPTLNGSRNGFASVFYDNSSGLYHLYCSWGFYSSLHFVSFSNDNFENLL